MAIFRIWFFFPYLPQTLHQNSRPSQRGQILSGDLFLFVCLLFFFPPENFGPSHKATGVEITNGTVTLSSSLSAIRVLSSAYLRLLIFLPAILTPARASSSPGFRFLQTFGHSVFLNPLINHTWFWFIHYLVLCVFMLKNTRYLIHIVDSLTLNPRSTVTVSQAWTKPIQHTDFLCKALQSLLASATPGSTVALCLVAS